MVETCFFLLLLHSFLLILHRLTSQTKKLLNICSKCLKEHNIMNTKAHSPRSTGVHSARFRRSILAPLPSSTPEYRNRQHDAFKLFVLFFHSFGALSCAAVGLHVFLFSFNVYYILTHMHVFTHTYFFSFVVSATYCKFR